MHPDILFSAFFNTPPLPLSLDYQIRIYLPLIFIFMQKINFRPIIPHLSAVLIFLCLIFAYFPELLSKKTLRMDDIEQHKGMSNELSDFRERNGEEALWTNTMFGGMPGYLISVVYKGNLVRHLGSVVKLGLPRPADSMFVLMLGMYILLLVFGVKPAQAIVGSAAYCFSTYYLLIMEAGHMSKVDAISWIPWVFAGVLLLFKGKHMAGAILLALSFSLQIKSGHYQVSYYLLMIMGIYVLGTFIHNLVHKKLPAFGKAFGIMILVALLALSTNISSIFTIYDYGKDSIRGKSELSGKLKKDDGGLDKDYALDYSYGVGETFSYLIPNVYGGASNLGLADQKDALKKTDENYTEIIAQMPLYWSDTSTTGPFYAGSIVCFLCLLGFFLVKGPIKWVGLAGILIAFVLSWGKNVEGFSVFMLNNFPLYNKFRAVKMTLIISDFLIPLMAILGLNELIKNPEILFRKKSILILPFLLSGGICFLFWLSPDSFFSFDYLNPNIAGQLKQMLAGNGLDAAGTEGWMQGFMMNLEQVRVAVFEAEAMRSLLLVLIAWLLILAFSRFKFHPVILTVLLGLFIIGDLWQVDKRYVNKKDFVPVSQAEIPFQPSVADESIYSMEVKTNKNLNQKIEKFQQDAIESSHLKGNTSEAQDAKYRFRGLNANTNYRVLNLTAPAGIFNDAATSYFHKSVGGYSAAKLERYQEFIEYHLDSNLFALRRILQTPMPDSLMAAEMKKLYALNMLNTRYIIYNPEAPAATNRAAAGNAWFVSEIKTVSNADEEINSVRNFNPEKEAIVDKRFRDQVKNWKFQKDSSASIELNDYAPNKLTYTFKSSVDQLTVFSEIYYEKGWNAYIDGKKVPHFRVDYLLRAMVVPAGEHTIKFVFEPEIFFTTEKISYLSSGLLLIGGLSMLIINLKRKYFS